MTTPESFAPGYRLTDGNQLNFRIANPQWSTTSSVSATSGGTMQTSAKVVNAVTNITNASVPGAGITLPQAIEGTVLLVSNNSSNDVRIFATGESTINGLDGQIGILQAKGTTGVYVAIATKEWSQLNTSANAGYFPISTINTDLKALKVNGFNLVYAEGYWAIGDGGGGYFYGVTGAAPGTYTNNNGTVIIPSIGPQDGSCAWLRIWDYPLNVKWFGAKGNGVADDTAAIQATINVMQAGSAGVNNASMLLPSGQYNISSTLVVDQGIGLTISGIGSSNGDFATQIYTAVPIISLMRINMGGITVQGLIFTAPVAFQGTGATNTGLEINGTSNADADTYVLDCGFYYMDTCVSMTAKNVVFSNTNFSNSIYGIKFTGSRPDLRGMVVEGCRFHTMGGSVNTAWAISIDPASNFTDTQIVGCYFDDCNGVLTGYSSGLVFSSNLVTRNYGGIELDATAHGASAFKRACIIGSNDIQFFSDVNQRYGIHLKGYGLWDVFDNSITSAGFHGIYVETASTGMIHDNRVYNCGQDASGNYDCINIAADSQGCSIYNNTVVPGTHTRFGLNVLGYGSLSGQSANYIGKNFFYGFGTNAVNIANAAPLCNVGEITPFGNNGVTKNGFGGDTDSTVVVGQDSVILRQATTLTADRVLTLSDTNVYDGAQFTILRVSGGAFNYNIENSSASLIKALAVNEWATVVWSGGAGGWILSGFGSL